MRQVLGSLLIGLFLVAGFGLSAFADDLQPPPWVRGGPRTTFERWEFGLNTNPAPADLGYYNPNGVPLATMIGQWDNFHDNRQGVWDLANGSMSVEIPNYPDHPEYHKNVWVQLTWDYDATESPVVNVNNVAGQIIENDVIGPANSWNHTTWLFVLPDNPPSELLYISGNIRVDQLVVDTICPEPGSLLLLVGGVGLLAARARRTRIA